MRIGARTVSGQAVARISCRSRCDEGDGCPRFTWRGASQGIVVARGRGRDHLPLLFNFSARLRVQMKKILFITPALPAATDSGAAHRSHYLLTELQKLAEVHVCTCSPVGIPHDRAKSFATHTTYLGNIPIPRR